MAKRPIDFNTLKTRWYTKLAKAGFEDIELNEHRLRTWSHNFTDENTKKSWQAKETYYRLAINFLNDYKFESNLDKVIWEYHSLGISARHISETLFKAGIKKYKKSKVWLKIDMLRAEMKKMYMNPEQR